MGSGGDLVGIWQGSGRDLVWGPPRCLLNVNSALLPTAFHNIPQHPATSHNVPQHSTTSRDIPQVAQGELSEIGVQVITDTAVVEITEDSVRLCSAGVNPRIPLDPIECH